MTRRALGRGRFLIVVGSLITLVGMVPAWWVVERTGQPALTGNGFEGAGLVVFLSPDLLPFPEKAAMLLGFAGIAAGFFTLVWRLRPGGDDDDDYDPDQGAKV